MTVVEQARESLPGFTVRYEELTASPSAVIGGLCGFLGVPFQPGMLDYGRFDHAGFTPGLGDSSLNIRSGRIQPPAPVPGEVPEELAAICAAWGYQEALPGGRVAEAAQPLRDAARGRDDELP